MRKRLSLQVPRYLKKYLLHPEFGQVVDGELFVHGRSFIGSYISSVARPMPFVMPKPDLSATRLTIWYSCRERTHEVPQEKLANLVKSLDEQFRRALICEVRALHELCGGDYSKFIRNFLGRYEILADVDVDFETVRKIYRDYLDRVDKSNRELALA